MPSGIQYIKVAKIDATGVDRSDHLDQIQTLRLNFTDLGIVSFQVNDKVEKTNYYQFTVNPIEPLPGGAISSSDNIVYNYTSSIPGTLSGSLTQAKEITDLSLSGGFSNWENGGDIYSDGNKFSTVYGEMPPGSTNYGYYNTLTSTPTENWNNIYPYNQSVSREEGLTPSTFLMERLQNAGEFVNLSESISLPPQLQLITSSGFDYGTNIKVNRTPNTEVPFTFKVAWCNADTGSGASNFYKAASWTSVGSVPGSVVSASGAMGPGPYDYFVWFPGKVMLGCYKNDILQNYITSSIFSQSFFVPGPSGPYNKTAPLTYSSTLNDLGVVSGDEISFKIFGYSNYMCYVTEDDYSETPFVMIGKLSGSTCTTPSSFLYGPPAITESFRNATQVPIETFSGPPLSTITTPYFNQEEFNYSGADVLMNNVDSYPPNPFLNDLDYETSLTTPVNLPAIYNNTATKGTVPESNYTQLSSINPRYLGSKNQSEKINQWTPKKKFNGVALTTDFGNLFNIGTYGKTSPVDSLDTTLYEYEYGGGTTPEILGWGSFKLGKLFQVDTTESVHQIFPTDNLEHVIVYKPWVNLNNVSYINTYWGNAQYTQSLNNFYYTVNSSLKTNNEISFYQYNQSSFGSNPPEIGKVLSIGCTVPSYSNFAIFSKNESPFLQYQGVIHTGSFLSGLGLIEITGSSDFITTMVNGYVTQSDQPAIELLNPTASSMVPDLTNSKEKWFLTVYNNMHYPIDNDLLEPMNVGYSSSLSNPDTNYLLASKGVYEIAMVTGSINPFGSTQMVQIYTTLPFDPLEQTNITDMYLGSNGKGILIWKAKGSYTTEHLIVQNNAGAGSPGAIINKYSANYLSQNLGKITKNFGSNTV